MKITKQELKRIINEEMSEVSNSMLEYEQEEKDLTDPGNPLEMSSDLEAFRNDIASKALNFLRARDDQKIELEVMNLINSQMKGGTEMSDLVGRMLADMYQKGLRGQEPETGI